LAEDLANTIKKYTLPRTSSTDMAARAAALATAFGVKPGMPVTQVVTPVAAPRVLVQPPTASAVRVTTRSQYDALPSGTDYIDSQGNSARKP
jgi:hypothetical protein